MTSDARILAYIKAVVSEAVSNSDNSDSCALWRSLTEDEQTAINRFSVVCAQRIDPDDHQLTESE